MNKKKLLQIFLFFLALIISVSTFYSYFYTKNIDKEKLTSTEKNKIIDKSSTNLINEISYYSVDKNGNKYEIKSKQGNIDIKNPDLIFMTGVKATINLANLSSIDIFSDFAKYNNQTYETEFEKNILITYESHTTTGDNLDLSFENNYIHMYNNIIYTNKDSKLEADRLEIDLITKKSKIFMNNAFNKIKILTNQ